MVCIVGLIAGPADPAHASEHLVGFAGAVILSYLSPIGIGVFLLRLARKAKRELPETT
jgi:hypothetical protein